VIEASQTRPYNYRRCACVDDRASLW